MTSDIHTRLARVVRTSKEAMESDVASVVGRRRDWHLNLSDFGKALPSAWDSEVARMQKELEDALEKRQSALADQLKGEISEAEAEWATVSPDDFSIGKLHGFRGVWGNRLLRAGIGVGRSAVVVAGMKAGAAFGAALGLPGGPLLAVVTGAIGGVGGLVATAALKPLVRLVDRLVVGKAGVLKKRRREVGNRVGPILDHFSKEYTKVVADYVGRVQAGLDLDRSARNERSDAFDRSAAELMSHSDSLRALIEELDSETASTLLRLAGRERLARSVRHATRVPGVCILTEFEPSAFWEAWLFPPGIGEKLVPGKARFPGGKAAASLTYALGWVEGAVSLIRADSRSAALLIEGDVPVTVTHTWRDAISQHLSCTIRVEIQRKANA